jgi:hypothetical protein
MGVLKKEWTDARKRSFIKGGLRSVSQRWPEKYECLADAFVGKQICRVSGRLGKHYKCNGCNGEYAARFVQVDHIEPIVDPAIGFVDWNTIIERMFCSKENLQVLCKTCHDNKTASEREVANKTRKSKTK